MADSVDSRVEKRSTTFFVLGSRRLGQTDMLSVCGALYTGNVHMAWVHALNMSACSLSVWRFDYVSRTVPLSPPFRTFKGPRPVGFRCKLPVSVLQVLVVKFFALYWVGARLFGSTGDPQDRKPTTKTFFVSDSGPRI